MSRIEDFALLLGFTTVAFLLGSIIAIGVFIFMRIKKIAYQKYEYLSFFLPLIIWWSLALTNIMSKSLSNIIEPLFVGAIISVLAIFRLTYIQKMQNKSQLFLGLSCLAATIIYFTIPGIPE